MTHGRSGRACALASLALLAGFDLLVTALHVLDRALNPIVQAISEYALGPFGWVLTIALTMFGASILFLAVALWMELPGARPHAGFGFLALAGLGPLLAAAFRTDPVDLRAPDATVLTAAGTMHLIGFAMAVLGIVVAAPILSRRIGIGSGRGARTIRVLGWSPLLAVVVFWATGMWDHELGSLLRSPSVQGLAERVMVLLVQIWLVAAAISVLRTRRSLQSRGERLQDSPRSTPEAQST